MIIKTNVPNKLYQQLFTPNVVSQVIYPELRPEWVISAETITK